MIGYCLISPFAFHIVVHVTAENLYIVYIGICESKFYLMHWQSPMAVWELLSTRVKYFAMTPI